MQNYHSSEHFLNPLTSCFQASPQNCGSNKLLWNFPIGLDILSLTPGRRHVIGFKRVTLVEKDFRVFKMDCHNILTVILGGKHYYNSHLTDEDIETRGCFLKLPIVNIFSGARLQTQVIWLQSLGSLTIHYTVWLLWPGNGNSWQLLSIYYMPGIFLTTLYTTSFNPNNPHSLFHYYSI